MEIKQNPFWTGLWEYHSWPLRCSFNKARTETAQGVWSDGLSGWHRGRGSSGVLWGAPGCRLLPHPPEPRRQSQESKYVYMKSEILWTCKFRFSKLALIRSETSARVGIDFLKASSGCWTLSTRQDYTRGRGSQWREAWLCTVTTHCRPEKKSPPPVWTETQRNSVLACD